MNKFDANLVGVVIIIVDALIFICISLLFFKAPKTKKEIASIKEYLISSSLAGLGGILFFLIILGNIGAGLWILSRSLNFNILITIFIYGSPFVFLGVSINTFLRWMFWKKLDKYIQRNVK